jgi:hypothetical protein
LYDKITAEETARFLRVHHKFTVNQFVFFTSTLVYKRLMPEQNINEDWHIEPKWD